MENYTSLSDIRTYRQSIDFMHDNQLVTYSLQSSSSESNTEDDQDEQFDTSRLLAQKNIGACLLDELELFRKTYIILSTHIDDCVQSLLKIYTKYLRTFFSSLKRNHIENENFDLMLLIACENTIVGFLFTKLWPCVLRLNYENDQAVHLKCIQLTNYLKLKSSIDNFKSPMIITDESANLCSKFFNIEQKYFRLNTQPILTEIKRLPLLNVPYEKLECIKTVIDLLSNELTITLASQKEQAVITSEILIPLVAFILIKSGLNCLYSIVFFIEKFQLSAQQTLRAVNSMGGLDELAYFVVTFRTAIQFIESSKIYI